MRNSFAEVSRYAEAHDVSNRIPAYMLAIDRVAHTRKKPGWGRPGFSNATRATISRPEKPASYPGQELS
jgi:hypothetical protein